MPVNVEAVEGASPYQGEDDAETNPRCFRGILRRLVWVVFDKLVTIVQRQGKAS